MATNILRAKSPTASAKPVILTAQIRPTVGPESLEPRITFSTDIGLGSLSAAGVLALALTGDADAFQVVHVGAGVGGEVVKVKNLASGFEQTFSGVKSILADGGAGDDLLDFSAGNLSSQVTFAGGDGLDTIVGPAGDTTWVIDGENAGSAGANIHFLQVENATGAVGNQDEFVFEQTGSLAGTVSGGTAFGTGSIFANAVGQLSISGSVVGGDLDDAASDDLEASALIQIKKASSIIIGGSLVSGSDYSGGNVILNSATIRVEQNVGKLIIKGSVLGTADTQIFITASGQETIFLNTDQDVAFGSIAIGGSVIHSSILAGYGTGTLATESEENPNAQIGTVVVGGDWIASNLLSGARWSDSFGDGLDSKAAGVDSPAITACITSIAIVGQIIGTASSSTDQFRFMAQAIDKMTVGGSLVSLDIRKGNDNDLLAPRYNLANTLDVRVFEFPDV